MGPTVFGTISINILSNLLTDLTKRAGGTASTALEKAIEVTAEAFPQIEGLNHTLIQWLTTRAVTETLGEFSKGLKGVDEVRIDYLAETFLQSTQFFLADGAEIAAKEIISRFLFELRNQYLKVPELGITIVANRLEHSVVQAALYHEEVREELEGLAARFSGVVSQSDEKAIDSEIDEAKHHLENHEYDLARHVCDGLRGHKWDHLSERQKFRALSISAASNAALGKIAEGARLFIEAKAWQPDDEKAVANEARAYQMLGKTERAFDLAAKARERFPNSPLAMTVWLYAAPASCPLLVLEAAIPAHLEGDVEVISALAQRTLAAGKSAKAEKCARRALAIKNDWSYPWLLLAESIFRSALPDTAEDYWRFSSLADARRLNEADEACTKAVEFSKKEKQSTIQAQALLVRAEIRRGLGNQVSGDEDVIAAWSLGTDDLTVLREYARLMLQRGQSKESVVILRSAAAKEDRDDIRMLLGLALSNTGTAEDRAEATMIFEELATSESASPSGFRRQATVAALESLSKGKRWDDGRKFLGRLSPTAFSDVASLSFQARWELDAGNRQKASELARNALSAVTESTSTGDVRLTAALLGDLGHHREALPLWQRLASPRYLGHDTGRLIDCALRVGQYDVFFQFCEKLRANGVYDRQLIEVESGVREHYNVEGAISLLQDYLSRFPEDRAMRLHLSAIGMRLDRKELVASDPTAMPKPEDVSPENWKLIVLVMKHGSHLEEALRFSYDVLRRHFFDPEAHRAYLAATLIGPRPEIAIADIAGPGMAIAFREEGSTQEEWRIIEDENTPDPNLQEIGPDHVMAQNLKGKRVGETFLVAEGPLTSTKGTITQILNKYVYRFQDCTGNWQKRFPGLPDIQSIRVVKLGPEGGREVDLSAVFKVLDRIAGHDEAIINAYRAQPIPIHLVAQALGQSEFVETLRLAVDEEITIKCCAGTAEERTEAVGALRNANFLVLDLSAIATLFLLDALEVLERFTVPLLVSELTFGQLKTSEMKAAADDRGMEDGAMRFLGKREGRYLLQELQPELLQKRWEYLNRGVERIRSHCNIVACPDLSAVLPDKRDLLVKAFGEHGAQIVTLASTPGRVLWTDDFAVAMIARHEFGVRRVWTQVVLQERTEAGVIEPEMFFGATAKLAGWRYYFTSLSTQALIRAGSLAEWNPSHQLLKNALEQLSDTGIAIREALSLAISFIVHYSNEVALPEVRNALTIQVLESIGKRGEGLGPVRALIAAAPAFFSLNAIRAKEFIAVVRSWIAAKEALGWR